MNYECDVTAANTGPAQATVGLIVGNAFQCSGTLINDVPHDGKPYVLTARHCENSQNGGGDPGAAANVVIYWDATSPCGSVLGTLYDPGIVTQLGATTVVEQQDTWLLLLSQPPAASDAFLAGFDATGGAIQGGYTIHHALSNDKQLTAWNGTAITQTIAANTSLPVTFTSNFWDVVNLTGTIGPGAWEALCSIKTTAWWVRSRREIRLGRPMTVTCSVRSPRHQIRPHRTRWRSSPHWQQCGIRLRILPGVP